MGERLDGGVAIVTGSASGIGYALAQVLGERGARLFLIDMDAETLKSASHRLGEAGFDVVAWPADLRDLGSLQSAAEAAAALGPVQSLCLNAGVASTGATLWETPEAAFDLVMGVNLRGLFYSIKAFVPLLFGHDLASRVIVTASMAGLVASPYSAAYSASKAGAIAMAKALKAELAPWPRVRVSVVNPSLVKTNLIRNSSAIAPNAMSSDFVLNAQNAFDSAGSSPELLANHVFASIDSGEFWIMPPATDPFSQGCLAEINELRLSLDSVG